MESNETVVIPLAADFYTEEEIGECWYTRQDFERFRKTIAISLRILEQRMEQAYLSFDMPDTIPENQTDSKRGVCFRGVEAFVSVRNEERTKRMTEIWKTVVIEQEIKRRLHQKPGRQSFRWITKNLKKNKNSNKRLATRLSHLTMDCKLEALVRGKKDAEVARRLRMEDIKTWATPAALRSENSCLRGIVVPRAA